ncbi:MAG TPA: biotin/lipoyl-containing protein, partial [Clostridia bacterium]|nr:biotin/lipoyl-containing protein [Clostridia bacterium]
MPTPIIMPKFGQMTEESAIVEWCKKEGDQVAKGDILFTVETDKSVMEVESFEEGTLLKIVVKPGVNVPVQSTVGFLGKPGEVVPEATAPVAPVAPKAQSGNGSPASAPAR